MSDLRKKVVVLGAGISGLSAAWRLAERGFEVDVVEAANAVGGLAGTMRVDGYCLDMGPHSLFTENAEILETIQSLFGGSLKPIPRRARFYYNGRYLDYPLTPYSVLFQMGPISSMTAVLSLLRGRTMRLLSRPALAEEETVEQWAKGSFGGHLYRTFFKPYTEQFWKISCSQLSAHCIPTYTRMGFVNTCRLLLRRRRGPGGASQIEREALPMYYPPTGFGELPEKVAQAAGKSGARIHLGCEVVAIRGVSSDTIKVVCQREGGTDTMAAAHVVSTIPAPRLIEMLHPPAPDAVRESARHLGFRALAVLGLATEKSDVLGCGYAYVLHRPYNRITQLNEFSPQTSPPGENLVLLELSCLQGDAVWTASKEDLFERCIESLSKDGVMERGDIKRVFLLRAPYVYPIYLKGYARHLEDVLEYVAQCEGIETLGRCGEFRYGDADQCMGRALQMAEGWAEAWRC